MTERFFSLEYSAPRTNEALERLKKLTIASTSSSPTFAQLLMAQADQPKKALASNTCAVVRQRSDGTSSLFRERTAISY